MNDEVIKMLVSVQDELARAVLQVNVVQRRDDDVIAHLQSELLKAEQRAEKQELRAETLEGMLIHARQQRDGSNMMLRDCAGDLTRTRNELVRVNNELASVMAHLPAVKQEPQQPRAPAKRQLVFGDHGDHDHYIDLETPKKK